MIHLSALTMEQKEYAAEHHNLVYRFLRLNRLDESEFYDVVIFGYLKAVREYLENQNCHVSNFLQSHGVK